MNYNIKRNFRELYSSSVADATCDQGNPMKKNDVSMMNRIKGALYGVAVGDAMGAPTEFMSEEQVKRTYGTLTEMIGWRYGEAGECTDDTQMTIAVAEGILENPEEPYKAIGKRFIHWFVTNGKGCGNICMNAIEKAMSETAVGKYPDFSDWYRASSETSAENGGMSGGNGALMRTVYPALYYKGPGDAVTKAMWIALMTHNDKDSTNICSHYTWWIHDLTDPYSGMPWKQAYRGTLLNLYHDMYRKDPETKPTGWVVDTIKCALNAFEDTITFEDMIIQIINRGGDADTIAAIAGGLAGAYYGYQSIPERWINTLDPQIRSDMDKFAKEAYHNRYETK